MTKQMSIHGLQNDIEELQEQLKDATIGLIEWREVAIEVLDGMKGVKAALDTGASSTACQIAIQILAKYPT